MAEAVREDGQACFWVREDRLRVELDRGERKLFVLDRHDLRYLRRHSSGNGSKNENGSKPTVLTILHASGTMGWRLLLRTTFRRQKENGENVANTTDERACGRNYASTAANKRYEAVPLGKNATRTRCFNKGQSEKRATSLREQDGFIVIN